MNDKQVMHALSIDDVYDVERVLARGKTGTTELVTAKGSGPFVRKKMARELVRRGVWSALLDCDCPRLPRIEATYQMPDEFVVVYDFIPGKNLQELVAERGRLPEDEAVALALDICEAASAIHALGVIHRDITPKNVIVSGDGAHLIDFGIARMYTEGASRDTTTLGTFGFASPEQYGFEQTDARSDVYSIGRVLGYLLTGIMPNDEGYREALLDESVVSDQMRAIVDRACAMEPSARYQSAADLAAALRGEKCAEPDAGVAAGADAAGASGREGAVISRRFSPSKGAKTRKNDGTPKVGRARRVTVIVAVALMGILTLGTIMAFLGKRGLLPWTKADAGSTPTWSGSYKPSSSGDSSGGGTGGTASSVATSDDDAPIEGVLEVGETSWYVSSGWVHVAYSLTNTSEDKLIRAPFVTAAARDASGSVLGTYDTTPSMLFPGQTVWSETQVTSAADVASVDVTPQKVEGWETQGASAQDASSLVVSDTACRARMGNALSVTGEVTCQKKSRFNSGQIGVTALFKDSAGTVVLCAVSMLDCPDEGASAPFEVYALNVPDFATYEVYAYDL